MLNFVAVSENEDVTRFPLKFTDPGQAPRHGGNMVKSAAASKACFAKAGGWGCSRDPRKRPPRGLPVQWVTAQKLIK